MKERIREILSERGMHTLDLYRKLKYAGTFSAFELILNSGLEQGLWECSDGYWKLPAPVIELDNPLDIKVHYLVNISRQLSEPSDKAQLDNSYFSHSNYQPKNSSVREMIWNNLNGYQIVPGQFARSKDGKIKQKASWQSQQVFMVEFDENVKETSLEEVVEHSTFIRDNAVALLESIRSCYNDPTDATCNGDLRYRVFFVMPIPVSNMVSAEFIATQLLNELPDACKSGSIIVNGAFGRKGAGYRILNNVVGSDYINKWREIWQTEQAERGRYQVSEQIDIKEIPSEYSERISELSYATDGWSMQMLPCIFNTHEHDGWHSRNNAMGVYRHTDTMGYTFHCFKCNGKRSYRVKPRKSGKRRVKQVSDSEAVYESLNQAEINNNQFWDFINSPRAFDRNRQVIHIQTDTGVGKDYAMIMESKRTDVISLNPHSGLSAQLNQRAKSEDVDSFHIKSRWHGFDLIEDLDIPDRVKVFKANPDVMCIHADRCQALLERTGSCKDVLCNADHCEVYDFCESSRYVSQIKRAAQCQLILYSWMQLPTDPGSAGIYAQIQNQRKKYGRGDAISVVGEVDATKLLNRHTISLDEIQKGIALWKDEPVSQLYRMLGEMCNPTWQNSQRWDTLIGGFPKLDFAACIRQLSRFPMAHQDKVTEVSVGKALSEKLISIDTPEQIDTIPRIYPRHWTLIQRLEQLLTYCVNPEPPLFFTGDGIEFVTPPVLHPMCDAYVMQSATADSTQLKNLITLASEDVTFHTSSVGRVEHHPDAKVFKIATGRYVRSSCFVYDSGYDNIVSLNPMILPHVQTLYRTLLNTSGKKFVNTYKAIYEGDELADEPFIQQLRELPDVQWSNWAAGYGLDLEPDTVVIEFGTNEPSIDVLKNACSEIYMSDDTPLDYTYVDFHEEDGIRTEGVRSYIDKRVQRQYEQMVSHAQYQMANRTRPVRNPSTVLIYSSHPCKWLDNRVQWITPDMLGGNLRELTIQAPQSEFQREKSEKQSLAIELAKEGLNNKEIATQLGYKSQSSVANLLKGLNL